MKKITIIGDSFGCGEWQTKDSPFLDKNKIYYREPIWGFNHDYIETHPGLEHFLEKDGHACHNISSGGASNIHTLKRLASSLMIDHPRHEEARFLNPEVIVWFYTEPLRDLSKYKGNQRLHHNMSELNDEILDRIDRHNYNIYDINDEFIKLSMEYAQKIYEATNIPFIIIESLGYTNDMEKNYTFCKNKISNWVGQIVGKKPPIISSLRIIEELNDETLRSIGYETVNRLLRDAESFWFEIKDRSDFPDGGHPDRHRHEELHKIIKEYI